MKKILLVLVMIAGSVFLAQPAVAEAEGTEAAAESAPAQTEPAAEPLAEDPPAEQAPAEQAPPPAEEKAPEAPAEEKAEEAPPVDNGNAAEPDESTSGNAPNADGDDVVAAAPIKVTICHATSSEANPYVENSPNVSGILGGHDGHDGGVFPTPGWGDIIPPFDNADGSFEGQNWTPEGQAIYNNGCAPVGEDPEPLDEATAVAPVPTAPTCLADGSLELPVTEGVIYEVDPAIAGPGTYTITATADIGYELTNPDFEVVVEVLPQLTGPQCIINGLAPANPGVSVTPATCSADGALVFEDDENINYFVIPILGNVVFVTALPEPGFYLTEFPFLEFVAIPQELTGAQCDTVDITICHRTNSNVNPYVVNGPATAGVANGHDQEHEGPIWNPTLKAQGIEWGDIIPPYTYNDVDYPGQNWTPEGIAFYNDGACDGAGIVPTEVTPEPPTAVPADCEMDGELILPETEGIVYTSAPDGTGPGDYVVTAAPLNEEFVLVGQSVFEITVDAQLSVDDCTEPGGEEDPDPEGEVDPAREDELLPDTGGIPLWMLLVAGPMTAGGLIILMRRQPVAYASTSGGMPTYSLTLPPVKKPAGITRAHASTQHIGFMKAVSNVVAAIGSFLRGGRR
ncbi:hypothetical protein [Aeromicrobium sp. NPDC092404]|uniref:hypothetical protein n=1 Tax=Aeromicrobium sp. NPDC092404 TaxID=3154976 RepID=UPI00344581AE